MYSTGNYIQYSVMTYMAKESKKEWRYVYMYNRVTLLYTATLFTIARSWKQPKCPSTDEWIKKMWYVYTMEYYSAIKRNEIGSFVETWMHLYECPNFVSFYG